MKKHLSAPKLPREPPACHSLKQPVPRTITLLLGTIMGQEGWGPLEGGRGAWAAWKLQWGGNSWPPRKALTVSLLSWSPSTTPLTSQRWTGPCWAKRSVWTSGRLLGNSCQFIPDLALMSFILFFGTYSMTLTLKKFKFSRYFPTKVTSPYSQTVHMEATTESLRGFWSIWWNGHHISTCSLRFFQVKSTDFGSERTGFPCCQAPWQHLILSDFYL